MHKETSYLIYNAREFRSQYLKKALREFSKKLKNKASERQGLPVSSLLEV
jgi:hypothetical protein